MLFSSSLIILKLALNCITYYFKNQQKQLRTCTSIQTTCVNIKDVIKDV